MYFFLSHCICPSFFSSSFPTLSPFSSLVIICLHFTSGNINLFFSLSLSSNFPSFFFNCFLSFAISLLLVTWIAWMMRVIDTYTTTYTFFAIICRRIILVMAAVTAHHVSFFRYLFISCFILFCLTFLFNTDPIIQKWCNIFMGNIGSK